jgi:hypothetical protein
MGDENRSGELPQRVRGAARAGSAPSAPAVLTDEMRERLQAAVKAERGHAAKPDQEATEPIQRVTESGSVDTDVATPAGNKVKRPMNPRPSSKPERIIKNVQPEHAVKPVKLVPPEPAAKPQPAGPTSANHESAAGLRARPDWSPRPQPSAQKPRRGRFIMARLVASVLVVIAAGALGIAVTRYLTSSPTDNRPPSAAEQRQEVAARDQAATWVAQQVSHSAPVSCDQATCAALEAAGFPPGELRVFGPTSPYPLTSAVVVVTQAVRNLFGTILSSEWAPAVLASFGSGDAWITVRVIAPDGAAMYQAALAADLAARKVAGADLVQVPGITFSATARQQLIAGQVDSRLLLAIAALASNEPMDILQFGNTGPGADADMPLRFAELAESSSSYVRSVRSYLGAVPLRFRPASVETVVLPTGQAVLRVEFTAPSPLGLLGPQSSH